MVLMIRIYYLHQFKALQVVLKIMLGHYMPKNLCERQFKIGQTGLQTKSRLKPPKIETIT